MNAFGWIHFHSDGQMSEVLLDERKHFKPGQASVGAARNGHGQRFDVPFLARDHLGEMTQSRLYPRQLGMISPMLLRGEVDDPSLVRDLVEVWESEMHVTLYTTTAVVFEHRGIGFLEVLGDSLSHDSHAVYRVHQGLSVRIHEILAPHDFH